MKAFVILTITTTICVMDFSKYLCLSSNVVINVFLINFHNVAKKNSKRILHIFFFNTILTKIFVFFGFICKLLELTNLKKNLCDAKGMQEIKLKIYR